MGEGPAQWTLDGSPGAPAYPGGAEPGRLEGLDAKPVVDLRGPAGRPGRSARHSPGGEAAFAAAAAAAAGDPFARQLSLPIPPPGSNPASGGTSGRYA